MARLVVDGERLVVRLSPLERLGAFVASEPEAPLSAVRVVRSAARPWRELRGVRAPGTGMPWVIALGTWRYRGGKDFCAVHGGGPAVIVELEGAAWGRFVVSSAEAAADSERLRAALPQLAPAAPLA